MAQIYNICGINVRCDFRYATMLFRAEKYLTSAVQYQLSVPHAPEKYPSLQQNNPLLTAEDCEIISTAHEFYFGLLHFGGFMLHSSAVVVDNKAYLFSAPSGTGKSTHTQQWLKLFGERALILNDDKPAIMANAGTITACGTPWSGKSDLNENLCVPLQGICLLSRAKENSISRADDGEAVLTLLNQTLRPSDPKEMEILLSLLNNVVGNIPIWKMGCTISLEAAEIAFKAMSYR